MNARNIILKPIITEKTTREAKEGKCSFVVAIGANKASIKKAIEDKFSVNVVGITTAIVKGRSKRVGKRSTKLNISPWKKATAKLGKGQKIDIFETQASS